MAEGNDRLSAIAAHLEAIARGDFGIRTEVGDKLDQVDGIIAAINMVSEELHAREQHRLELQNRLNQVERLALVGEFMASLSHELRAPLQTILSATELIQIQDLTPRVNALTETVEREVFRANRLIDNARALTRRPLHLETVDLAGLFAELFQFTRTQLGSQGVRLRVEDLSNLPPVRIDVDQFRQVTLNLVANAADAVVERYGRAPHENRRIEVGGRGGREGVTIHLRDYGSGIPKKASQRIFEPFFTTKHSGLGIGLSISKKLIEDQGGSLDFDTGPDGTTFHIALPVA